MNIPDALKGKVHIGQLVITQGVEERVHTKMIAISLCRHVDGDWGDIDSEDWKMNDDNYKAGEGRLVSVYNYNDEEFKKFYIITEATEIGVVTTILLPSEY